MHAEMKMLQFRINMNNPNDQDQITRRNIERIRNEFSNQDGFAVTKLICLNCELLFNSCEDVVRQPQETHMITAANRISSALYKQWSLISLGSVGWKNQNDGLWQLLLLIRNSFVQAYNNLLQSLRMQRRQAGQAIFLEEEAIYESLQRERDIDVDELFF